MCDTWQLHAVSATARTPLACMAGGRACACTTAPCALRDKTIFTKINFAMHVHSNETY